MAVHKINFKMRNEKFKLHINPNLLARQAFQTVDTIQKLSLDSHLLRNKTVLEYVVESYTINNYPIFNTHLGRVINTPEKKKMLEELLEKIINKDEVLSLNGFHKTIWLNCLNHIFYQGDLDIIQKYQKNFDEYLEPNIEFDYLDYKSHNLMRSAIQGKNFHVILWLLENYKFTFWNNYYYYILNITDKEQVECLFKILKLDKIEQYLAFNETDISIFFSHFKSQTLKKKMLDYIINLELCSENAITLERKNTLLKLLCNYYLEEAHYPMIKFILENKYLQENYLDFKTLDCWLTYIVSLTIDRYGQYKDNLTKTKIVLLLFSYIQDNTCIWDSFLDEIITPNYRWVDYGESILSYLVKLPKIIPLIKMINSTFESKGTCLFDNISNKKELFYSLLRYGCYETYRYLEPELIKVLIGSKNNGSIDVDYILSYALCNKDIRITKDYLKIWKHKFNANVIGLQKIEIDFRFIGLPKLSLEQKKKRLKLLTNYFTMKSIRWKLNNDLYWYYHYTDNVDFYYWYLSKFYQNIITPREVNNIELGVLYKVVFKTYNLELINHLLQITVCFFDNTQLFDITLTHGYSWFDDITQKVLKRCPPLKDMTDDQKKLIIEKLHYSKRDLDFDTWNKIIKILLEAKFEFKQTNTLDRWYGNKFNAYLVNIIKNNSNVLARALIANGMPFQPVIEYYFNYPYMVIGNNPIKYWISLYTLIRRLEFRITYKRKKNHCREFKSTIIDIQSRPPLEQLEKPVLQRGGIQYYQDLDEMEGLYGTCSIEFQKPIHAEPLDVISWLRKPEGIFSQKADGTLVKGLEIQDLFPFLPNYYESRKLDAEYIESLDIYLVFQIRSHVNHQSSFLDDYRELVNEHPVARQYCNTETLILESDTESKIRAKLENEFLRIQEFILEERKKHPSAKLWWPKAIYNFTYHNPMKKLEVLKIMEEFQRQKYIQLGNQVIVEEDNGSINQKLEHPTYLPTDGFILMDNVDKKNILKLKPSYQMTADLSHQNAIWRMEWDINQDKWIPREKRTDKIYPNPDILVKKLENYHRNPWKLDDIKYFLDTTLYYQNQYSKNTIKDTQSQEFIQQFRKITSTYIKKWILDRRQYSQNKYLKSVLPATKVLDLGCGFGEKTLWQNQDLEIHGVDIEPQIWLDGSKNNQSKKNSKHKHYKFYQNISKSWEKTIIDSQKNSVFDYYEACDSGFQKYSSREEETQYDFITSFMSFHNVYSHSSGIENLLDGLKNKINPGTKIIISFLDRDTLFSQKELEYSNKILLSSGSYIKYLGYGKIQYYYSWRHYEPQIEYCISQKKLETDLEKFGWKIESVSNNLNLGKNNNKNPWNSILDSLKLVCFSRIE